MFTDAPEVTEVEEASLLRGWLATAFAVLGPLGLSALIVAVSAPLQLPTMRLGFMGAVWWAGLVLPYSFVKPLVVSPLFGLFIAVVQWLLLALVLAVFTRRLSLRMTIATAFLTVLGFGLAVQWILGVLGHQLHFESI